MYLVLLFLITNTPVMCDFISPDKSGTPPQAAIDAARSFADGEELQFTGMQRNGTDQNSWLSEWGFRSNNKGILVDTVTNHVTRVSFLGDDKHPNITISMEEALDKVLAYLKLHKVDTNRLVLEDKRCLPYLTTNDFTYNIYIFQWHERTPEGIRLPNRITIEIEDDGLLVIYAHIDRKVEISLSPQVGVDTAIRNALELSGYSSDSNMTDIDLFVGWDRTAKQRLMWRTVLNDRMTDSEFMYIIDAQTGEKINGGKVEYGGSPPDRTPTPVLLAQAKRISADLSKTMKIEILSFPQKDAKYVGLYNPHAPGVKVSAVLSAKQKPKAFEEFKTAVSSISKTPIDFTPMMGPSTWMKVYMPGGKDVYYCRYTAGSFGVCWKENAVDRDKDPKAYDRARQVKGMGMINIGVRVDASFAGLIREASGTK